LRYDERRALADRLRAVVAHLIVAGPDPLGGDAVHLAARDPLSPVAGLIGRSCHDGADICALSTEHYVSVSPVFATATKPGYGPALGASGAAAVAGAAVPWLALGGIDSPARARLCAVAGAAGIAVQGAVMRAADPAATVAALVAAFEDGAPPAPAPEGVRA
ncbi:MAG: thiamine-phosphate pyrophosphorylase, partial [Actinoplanes sp.]|nr:thiamine-phosphate pyrophosphorylase [Actinoplanes sp.]